MKPAMLFLSHRIPFPPNKGDKIRSFHLLKYLSEHYRVYLGAFIDDAEDWQYREQVREYCEDCCFVRLDQRKARLKSLFGLITGEPLTLPYFFSAALARWTRSVTTEQGIQRAVIYSAAMAQYVSGTELPIERKLIDFVDIDSDKWRQYSEKKRWPMSWIYRREAKRLLAYERHVAAEFDASLFVSSAEATMFQTLAPEVASKTGFYNNGVDVDYFSPDTDLVTPYSPQDKVLVFTGAMDYWPNEDAVCWFAEQVFPSLKKVDSSLKLYIVGSNPTETVQSLEKISGVCVTGRVLDVRPYLKFAVAAVAPMRVARGIQNKVLEAMAMAKPVIVTPQALEGIAAEHGQDVLVADDEATLSALVKQVLAGQFSSIGKTAREKVTRDFSWDDNLPNVTSWLEDGRASVSGGAGHEV